MIEASVSNPVLFQHLSFSREIQRRKNNYRLFVHLNLRKGQVMASFTVGSFVSYLHLCRQELIHLIRQFHPVHRPPRLPPPLFGR